MEKIGQIIKKEDVKITSMSTDEGNYVLTTLIKHCVDLAHKKSSREKIVKRLRNGLEEIAKQNPEVYDSEVRSEIFWYLDRVFGYVHYDEIDIDELFS